MVHNELGDRWQLMRRAADHQRIAQAVDRVGFDAITISEQCSTLTTV